MSYLSTFNHENKAVDNWIKFIINELSISKLEKAQYFMMSGIALGDIKLIEYAIELDKTSLDAPLNNHILTVVDSILSPVTGCNFSSAVKESSQDTFVDIPLDDEEGDPN